MKLLDYLEKKKLEIEERYFMRELQDFYAWAAQKLSSAETIVFLHLPEQIKCIVLSKNPNSRKGYSVQDCKRNDRMFVSFIVCPSGEFLDCQKVLGGKENASQDDWQPIFCSARIEIWENKKRHDGRSLPLRFGFSQEEKTAMVEYVRKLVEKKLQRDRSEEPVANNPETEFSARFSEPVFLGVALWVRGQLRSSVIVKDTPLAAALKQAAEELPYDPRFKPVAYEEFSEARIEITVMHEPRLPLTQRETKSERIDPLKGYQISWDGGRRGWYFPEVFNCVRFSGMDDLLTKLSEKKAGVSRQYLAQAKKVTFEVTDFIESYDKKSILDLHGPVVQSGYSYTDYTGLFQSDLESCLYKAVQSLIRVQEGDGNIPPVCNPLTGKMKQIDWIRQALAGGALILAGQTLDVPVYQEAGEKAVRYMQKNFFQHPMLSLGTKTIASVYYAKTLLLLGRNEEASEIAAEVVKNLEQLKYSPISHLQIASLLISFGPEQTEFFQRGKTLLEKVLKDYDTRIKRGEKMQLAFFPEAISVLLKLSDYEKKNGYQKKAWGMTEWLTCQELADGSFPIVPGSLFAYTRGTGKVFEVLALEPERNKDAIVRVFTWLRSMQYTEENAYFISENIRPKILGGFRHDAINQEVWSDAAAHILIGGARLLYFLKTGKESREF